MATKKQLTDLQLAREQWDRYTTAMTRGHINYQREAKRNEDFYLGGGRQWDLEVKEALEAIGKPWLEENVIFPTVNTVLGYQTQSRMDIAYKPRGSDDQDISDVLSKLTMFIVDQNRFPWIESQVFADGMIQQRGYFDIRMNFDDNINGDIQITDLDPLDVIPDPDGKSANPDDWQDVTTTKWIPLDDIKIIYGPAKWRQVMNATEGNSDADFGADEWGEERNKFSDPGTFNSFYVDTADIIHVQILERQWYKLTSRHFFYDIETGDLYPVPDGMTKAERTKTAKAQGSEIITRVVKRIRWTVSTKSTILHDEWSPYDHFTVVPFFPYFRRGKTVGMVDNLIKTQEMLNKTYSQILHVINTTANSGWTLEENTLTNMETEDLEDRGGETGLVLEYKAGRQKPEKIEPNQIPTGLKDMVTSGVDLVRLISGVSETFQGGKGPEVSGVAIQSRVHQSAIQLATPIDNLFRTRNMIAERLLKLIQQFYTAERSFVITHENTEEDENEEVTINEQVAETGDILNDVTVGKYDVVIADVPTQITFQNAQFQQAIEMRKFGVEIPDDEMIRMSTLARKQEIAKKVSGDPSEEQIQAQQMEIEQLQQEIEKLEGEALNKRVDSVKKAAEAAQMIAANPSIAPLMDVMLEEGTAANTMEEQAPEQPIDENIALGQPQLPPEGTF